MVGIADFFAIAQQAGVFHFYLPFVLVFAIFYALLTKSKVFGDEKTAKRINAIVSLVAALYVVGFTPVGVQLISFADYLAVLFTDAAVVIVTLLVFLMVVYLLIPQKELKDLTGWWRILILIAAVIALALFFNAGGGAIFGIFGNLGAGGFGLSSQDVAIIVLILVTVLVIYWLTRGEDTTKKP
jgi:hypothetical protein